MNHINLTFEQTANLESEFVRVAEMSAAGQPGMLIGQVFRSGIVVKVIEHDAALELLRAMGFVACVREDIGDPSKPFVAEIQS